MWFIVFNVEIKTFRFGFFFLFYVRSMIFRYFFFSFEIYFLFLQRVKREEKKKNPNFAGEMHWKENQEGSAGRWPMWWYHEMHILFLSKIFFSYFSHPLFQFTSLSFNSLYLVVVVFFYYFIFVHFIFYFSWSQSRSHCYSDCNLDLGINIRCNFSCSTDREELSASKMKSNGFRSKFEYYGHCVLPKKKTYLADAF